MGFHRKPFEKERDLNLTAQFYFDNLPSREIAKRIKEEVEKDTGQEYHTSYGTVCRDIKLLRKQWAKDRINDIDSVIDEECQRINHVEREARIAWRKSIKDHTEKLKKTVGSPRKEDGGGTSISATRGEMTEKEVINFGDAQYLNIILKCSAERRKLKGLDAAKKIEHSAKESFLDFLMKANAKD